MNALTVDEYLQQKTYEHLHNGLVIVGRGRTVGDAKKDAQRQAKLIKGTPPSDFVMNSSGEKKKNAEQSSTKYYKYKTSRSIYWHVAVRTLIEKIGAKEIASRLSVTEIKVINWARQLSLPAEGVRDNLVLLVAEHLSKADRVRCNLRVDQ